MSTSLISKDNVIQLLVETESPKFMLSMIKKCLTSIMIDPSKQELLLTWLSDILYNRVTTDVRISLVQNFLIHNQGELISQVDTYLKNHSKATLNQWYLPCSEVYEYTWTSEEYVNEASYYHSNPKKIIKDLLELTNNYTAIVESFNPDRPIENGKNFLFCKDTWCLKILSHSWYAEYNDIHHVEVDKNNSNFLRITYIGGTNWIIDITNPKNLIPAFENYPYVDWDNIYYLDISWLSKANQKDILFNMNDDYEYIWFKFKQNTWFILFLENNWILAYYMNTDNKLFNWKLKSEYKFLNLSLKYFELSEVSKKLNIFTEEFYESEWHMFDREPLEPIYTSPDQSTSQEK